MSPLQLRFYYDYSESLSTSKFDCANQHDKGTVTIYGREVPLGLPYLSWFSSLVVLGKIGIFLIYHHLAVFFSIFLWGGRRYQIWGLLCPRQPELSSSFGSGQWGCWSDCNGTLQQMQCILPAWWVDAPISSLPLGCYPHWLWLSCGLASAIFCFEESSL